MILRLLVCVGAAKATGSAFVSTPLRATARSATLAATSGHGAPSSLGDAGSSAGVAWALAGTAAALIGGRRAWSKRQNITALRGLSDRIKKDFSTKSAMIRKLGKLVLQKEFDMRSQIKEDPKLAIRSGISQEELLGRFEVAVTFLKQELGCNPLEADICISKVATGLHMQHLGKPCIPTREEMLTVLGWLEANLNARKENGSLRVVVEKYPFVLGRTIEQLEESRRFCPPDIDYDHAVTEDPALIDKTYNCDGICANMCTACWYNG